MINPYPNLPYEKGGTAMQNYGTHASVKAVYASENASASSVITLTEDTTVIEIAPIAGTSSLIAGAVMRWVTSVAGSNASTSVISAAGTANFDHVIANNTVAKFAVPIERQDTNTFASVQGANRANGLYRRVAIKSIGVASVLLTEY